MNRSNSGGSRQPSQNSSRIPHGSQRSSQIQEEDPMAMVDVQEKRKLLNKWGTYFPLEPPKDFDPNDFKHLAVQVFYQFFLEDKKRATSLLEWEKKDDNFEQIVVHINYLGLYQNCNANVRQFLEFIGELPQDIVKSMALALDSVRAFVLEATDDRTVIVRFYNYNQIYPLGNIKSHLINKFVCMRGTVLRVSSIKVLVESIQFQCHECKSHISLSFVDGIWETPNRCISLECRSRIFNPEKHTSKTSFYQRVRVQEIENDVKDINAGKLPKTIDCEIRDDLIDQCISGDIVTVCGIMKTELQNDSKGGRGAKNNSLHASYIDVHSIRTSNTEYFMSQALGGSGQNSNTLMDQKMNISELNMIHKLAERRDLFPLLVKSICPSIFGNEIVKSGLLLCLFGGTDYRLKAKGNEFNEILLNAGNEGKDLSGMCSMFGQEEDMEDVDKTMPPIRPDIHCLMMGDPGLGKSQMLKHIINVAPRGVYVCGSSTTNAGLTATLVRDTFTNEQNLEAGALVLSDLGICCIDEFDKMTSDQSTLLEAMEQQTISIAKGGILGSLSARCSVLASANPSSGHYNRSRTIMENVRISNAILSRFDLVFLMLDDPDLMRDKKLSEHVMKLHSRNRKRKYDDFASQSNTEHAHEIQSMDLPTSQGSSAKRAKTNDFASEQSYSQGNNYNGGVSGDIGHIPEFAANQYFSLAQKVKAMCDKIPENQMLQPHILKKYISYAKHTVFPKLSLEACSVLKNFYISLRENATQNQNTLPVTSRALDSLIRMSQARAKLELRSIVSHEDAIEVVKLAQESIFEACYTEMGLGGFGAPPAPNAPQKPARGGRQASSMTSDPNNVSMLSIPKQTKCFVDRMRASANQQGTNQFEYQSMVELGKQMNLQVGDFRTFVDKLNANGILLKKHAKAYQLL